MCFLLIHTLYQVSVDQSVVDLDIAFRLGGFASTTIQLLGIVAVMSKVTWQVLILIVPMAIACMWMQVNVMITRHYIFTYILGLISQAVLFFLTFRKLV
jgi:hypothetical protein